MFADLINRTLKCFSNKKNTANHTDLYDELIKEAKKYFNEKEVLLIKKAYLVANDLHRGQKRNSGEPYIIHPLYVSYYLLTELKLHDASSIAASLLHDTIEDCGINYDFLASRFNADIASLVLGVTKMKDLDFTSKEEKEDYNNYLLLKHILEDYRVIYIKLADRLHNMRTLDYKTEAKRREKSAETLRIFVPLATHVGASLARDELADISFKYLSNRNYREIKGMSTDYQIKHVSDIETTINKLKEILINLKITPEIRPRIMSNFAIYQGLIENQKISLLPNLLSYQIMVENMDELNILAKKITENFEMMPEYTKDFITHPRNNGYQALHLSIKGRKGIPFQIRIFTKEMFLVNTYGFAALLDIYPNKKIEEIQKELIKNSEFFHVLEKNYKLYKKPFELINKSVRDLLADKINVYVANGALYCLPAMSTVADLADKIHSKLREEAIGAMVNGTEVDLNFPLKDNDRVLILTKEKTLPTKLTEENQTRILKKAETFQ